jgi:hypothetical protein
MRYSAWRVSRNNPRDPRKAMATILLVDDDEAFRSMLRRTEDATA